MTLCIISFILWAQGPGPLLNIEDLPTKALGPSCQNGSKVLLSNFVDPKLALFDIQQMKGRILDDGRIQPMLVEPMPWGTGFLLWDCVTQKITFLNANGDFVSQEVLPSRPKELASLKIRRCSQESDEMLLVTLKSKDEDVLASYDVKRKQWQLLLRQASDEKRRTHWVAHRGTLYRYEEVTGRIEELDRTSLRPRKTLSKGTEPVLRLKGRSPYYAIIESPRSVDDLLAFTWRSRRSRQGQELADPVSHCLVVQNGKCQDTSMIPIAKFQDQWLLFDPSEKLFLLSKLPSLSPVGGVW